MFFGVSLCCCWGFAIPNRRVLGFVILNWIFSNSPPIFGRDLLYVCPHDTIWKFPPPCACGEILLCIPLPAPAERSSFEFPSLRLRGDSPLSSPPCACGEGLGVGLVNVIVPVNVKP